MAFTVTIQQTAATANGIIAALKVVTGASSSQPGTTGAVQSAANLSITPGSTGSWVYGGLLLSGTGGVSPETGVTFGQNTTTGGLRGINMRTTSTQTAATPILMGATTGTGLDIALCEIIPSGTLTEDVSSPAVSGAVAATTWTTAPFTPPQPSLLVVMISSNGGTGTTTFSASDTSGLGLAWVEQVKSAGASKGYAGVWTAYVPAAVTAVPVMYSMRSFP